MINKVYSDLQNLQNSLKTQVKEKTKDLEQQHIQLLEQSRMASMGEMIGNIAHQWRQPLSAISTAASGMQLEQEFGTLDNIKMKDYTDGIVKNTKFLSNTIDTFRDFIKGEKRLSDVFIQDEISQALNISSAVLKNKFITLKDNINYKNKIKMSLVTGELPQVVINIINNAKDILLEKKIDNPYIQINLISNEKTVTITIEDNAGGIPDDIMPKIFDPYFTTKHQSQGTGLGLHMSYKIVTESLNGRLYAKNIEHGAKFFIELPL